MTPTKKQPLFIVSGASGIGKSGACEVLFENESDYIVMESDILWHPMYDQMKTGFKVLNISINGCRKMPTKQLLKWL